MGKLGLVAADSDQEDKRPASRRVAADLLERIDAGEYPPDSPLPTYRELAASYGIAVNTALAAVRYLRDLGVVTIRPNAGAKVRDRAEDRDIEAELTTARSEVADLRARVRDMSTDLAALEKRLSTLVDRFGSDQG